MSGREDSFPELRLESIYAPIKSELQCVEELLLEIFNRHAEAFGGVVEHLAHYRGKRFRPALLLLVGKSRGQISRTHIEASACVEMIHTASLAHDDVLDEADMRRGRPSLNSVWGNQVSVMAGDLLFAEALSLMTSFASRQELSILSKATVEMSCGELIQLLTQDPIAESEYIEIVSKKTGALCGAACGVGASLSGATPEELEAYSAFGRAVGIAFQIADDCLDYTGQESVTGKTLGSDLDSKKWTLPLLRLYEVLDTESRSWLLSMLRDSPSREQVIPLLAQEGCVDYAYRRAYDFLSIARNHLDRVEDGLYKSHLLALARYAVARVR